MRGAISLAPRLQPGDSQVGIENNVPNRFCRQNDQEKPLETVQEIIL